CTPTTSARVLRAVDHWDAVAGVRGRRLRDLFYTRPPLDAATVNRLWQTHVRPSLDAAAAYARSTQRMTWAVDNVADAAACAHTQFCCRKMDLRHCYVFSTMHNNH
ncbi:hypothetical protein GW17_00061879, partial [Ensete ventricosum]